MGNMNKNSYAWKLCIHRVNILVMHITSSLSYPVTPPLHISCHAQSQYLKGALLVRRNMSNRVM